MEHSSAPRHTVLFDVKSRQPKGFASFFLVVPPPLENEGPNPAQIMPVPDSGIGVEWKVRIVGKIV